MPAPYRIVLARRAESDLSAVFDYLAHYSPKTAKAMIDKILRSIELLEGFPYRNVVSPQPSGAKSAVRSLPIKPYVVFFRIDEEGSTVRILRVRHGARRPLRRY